MAVYPFFRADDSDLMTDDALLDASQALGALSLLISTTDADLGKTHLYGVGVMMDALASVMRAAAGEVAAARKAGGTDSDAYQLGLAKGLEAGRKEGRAANIMEMMELAPDDDSSRFFFDNGRAAALAEAPILVDRDFWDEATTAAYQKARQEFVECHKGPADEGAAELVPRLTEEAPAKGGSQSQASA